MLKAERKISFEEILFYMNHGFLKDTVDHPNQTKYPSQRLFVVQVGDYIYLVPFVEEEERIFLKTIIPSRKAKKKYLKGRNE